MFFLVVRLFPTKDRDKKVCFFEIDSSVRVKTPPCIFFLHPQTRFTHSGGGNIVGGGRHGNIFFFVCILDRSRHIIMGTGGYLFPTSTSSSLFSLTNLGLARNRETFFFSEKKWGNGGKDEKSGVKSDAQLAISSPANVEKMLFRCFRRRMGKKLRVC